MLTLKKLINEHNLKNRVTSNPEIQKVQIKQGLFVEIDMRNSIYRTKEEIVLLHHT